MRTIQEIVQRVRAEYLEMPGLSLRHEQVQRLCGLPPTVCQAVLDSLVSAKFLCLTSGGRYVRLTDGEISRSRAAQDATLGNAGTPFVNAS